MNPSLNPLSTPEAIFHPCRTSFSSDENSPAATYTYMSIYINPEPIALLNFNGFNLTENVWNFVWVFHEILFEIHTQPPRKKQPIKSSKNRFDICTGDFFLLLPAGPCFLFNIYYYYVGLARCDCFISFSFLCIVFHEHRTGSLFMWFKSEVGWVHELRHTLSKMVRRP